MLKLNVTVQYLALKFCVLDVLGSNPGPEIYYPYWGFHDIPKSPPKVKWPRPLPSK
jgi:hypothetical protein